jgi:hypothetical protein
MSSGTLIDDVRLKPGSGDSTLAPSAVQEAGFKPWHFFVLASLAAATVAVLMSRQSTPEHLVLLSLTIGAAGAAAAGFYRMLAPLAMRDASLSREQRSDRARAAIEREKALVLRSIKELEFDRAMGKVSPRDFDEMAGRLRARAMMLIKEVDAGGSGYRELIERELAARLSTRGTRRGGTVPDGQVRLKPDTTKDAGDAQVRLKPDATTRRAGQKAGPKPDASMGEAATSTGTACAACATINDQDAAFCKRCGTKLEVTAS